ncbi:hypothetical protein GCM10018987_54440 [Streptomyces cremeus]
MLCVRIDLPVGVFGNAEVQSGRGVPKSAGRICRGERDSRRRRGRGAQFVPRNATDRGSGAAPWGFVVAAVLHDGNPTGEDRCHGRIWFLARSRPQQVDALPLTGGNPR